VPLFGILDSTSGKTTLFSSLRSEIFDNWVDFWKPNGCLSTGVEAARRLSEPILWVQIFMINEQLYFALFAALDMTDYAKLKGEYYV